MALGQNDLILVKECQRQNEDARNELYNRYKHYVSMLVTMNRSRSFNSGVTTDDIYSRCLASLEIAISKFDVNKSGSFFSYWETIANNEIHQLFKIESYAGKAKAFYGISLDDTWGETEYSNSEIMGFEEPHLMNEDVLHARTVIYDTELKINVKERQMLFLVLEGLNKEEAAILIGIKGSTMYHYYAEVVHKVREFMILKKYL